MQKIEQRAMSNATPCSRGSVPVPELDNRGWNITLFNVLNETAPIKRTIGIVRGKYSHLSISLKVKRQYYGKLF